MCPHENVPKLWYLQQNFQIKQIFLIIWHLNSGSDSQLGDQPLGGISYQWDSRPTVIPATWRAELLCAEVEEDRNHCPRCWSRRRQHYTLWCVPNRAVNKYAGNTEEGSEASALERRCARGTDLSPKPCWRDYRSSMLWVTAQMHSSGAVAIQWAGHDGVWIERSLT